MNRLKLLALSALLFSATACSTPTRVYYWQQPNVGGEQFVRDHNKCLQKADFWPFSWFNPIPNIPEDRDLRLDLENGGIWGNYIPYPGAMPLYVNTAQPTWSRVYWWYARCMRKAGYTERRPYGPPL